MKLYETVPAPWTGGGANLFWFRSAVAAFLHRLNDVTAAEMDLEVGLYKLNAADP
jgi:hypothetical protein